MPRGLMRLDRLPGVTWDFRGFSRVGHCTYEWMSTFKRRLRRIAVTPPQSFRRIHFLHGAQNASFSGRFAVTEGEVIGRYRLHYVNGETREIRLVAGRDLLDWLEKIPAGETFATDTNGVMPRLAWTQPYKQTDVSVYHTVRENPIPGVDLASVELQNGGFAAPFVLAITLE